MKQCMEIDDMLRCFSLFYLRPVYEDWVWLERRNTWERFTNTIRHLLTGRVPTAQFRAYSSMSVNGQTPIEITEDPLSRWLLGETKLRFAENELAQAPTFEKHQDFASRHYVGGLPTSVLPVESFYRCWTTRESATLSFAHQTGLYGGDPAAHMANLLEKFELIPSGDVALPPDHLAIELEFLGLLSRYGDTADLRHFIDDHLSWLPSYVDTLLDRVPEARIYLAMTVLLIGCLETLRLRTQAGLQYR